MKPETADKPVNDRTEGILRDPVVWRKGGEGEGEIVSYVKDVGVHDPGYDAKIRQVLIAKQDGTTEVVPESEILRQREVNLPLTASEPARVPEATTPPVAPGDDAPDNLQAREPVPAEADEGEDDHTNGGRRKKRK